MLSDHKPASLAGESDVDVGSELVFSPSPEVEQLVRARGTMFLVTNRFGNVTPASTRELGLFVNDTRHLSHYHLRLLSGTLVLLSSESADPAFNQVDMMVAGVQGDLLDDPEHYVHIRRRQLLDEAFAEEITITSYLQRPLTLELQLEFAADFADVFEVRGAKRIRRGHLLSPGIEDTRAVISYLGRDGVRYETALDFYPRPELLTQSGARYRIELSPAATTTLSVNVKPSRAAATADVGDAPRQHRKADFERRTQRLYEYADAFRTSSTRISCDHPIIQQFLQQAVEDLFALRTQVGGGDILAAGIPWFCAPFGRDALLASYESLLLNPTLARDSLRVLANHQGKKLDDETEEEPGKILHELRSGEMVRTKETPHAPYYGSVDATPLFVVVLDAYEKFTRDRALLEELQPALLDALHWIDRQVEQGEGLVRYRRRSPRGLDNQGWKDSRAALCFPDGELAVPPIALCEVQGYCIDGYQRGARLLSVLGKAEAAEQLRQRAAALRERFHQQFWLSSEQRYAFAVDGAGSKLSTIVSNVGHLLWSRVPDDARARATANLLLSDQSFSGFGVRTLASGQGAYNPLSYHNGTVWPHDNAIIAKGFANYRLMHHAEKLFEGLVAAMEHLPDRRLPELFCGMARENGGLVRYPVACRPQAWAAAAPFLLLQSILGIHPDAENSKLAIRNASLPPSLSWVELDNLRIGQSRVALRFRRIGGRVHLERLDVSGAPLRVEMEHD